jgi:hypothetical protein
MVLFQIEAGKRQIDKPINGMALGRMDGHSNLIICHWCGAVRIEPGGGIEICKRKKSRDTMHVPV